VTPPAAARETDGRRLRAEATRGRIVEAMLGLVREGAAAPSAEAVAERAGVGLRTVFRLFSDMDSLYREMHAVMLAKLSPIVEEPFAAPDWRGRLDELILRRRRIFEEILPLKTAADAHRALSPYLQEEHGAMTRLQRQMLASILPEPFLQDTERLEALDLAVSFETWRRLRLDQRLSADATCAVVRRLVRALVVD
jgi:AcrR family transcriptional regulator